MYVCMYVCNYVCVCISLSIYIHIYIYIYIMPPDTRGWADSWIANARYHHLYEEFTRLARG